MSKIMKALEKAEMAERRVNGKDGTGVRRRRDAETRDQAPRSPSSHLSMSRKILQASAIIASKSRNKQKF